MLDGLKGVNGVMGKINEQMNPQEMNKIMKDFAKETMKMEMQSEMMTDQMDMMADPDAEGQAEEVYDQILAEVGMGIKDDTKVTDKDINPVAVDPQPIAADDDLQARLDALKK